MLMISDEFSEGIAQFHAVKVFETHSSDSRGRVGSCKEVPGSFASTIQSLNECHEQNHPCEVSPCPSLKEQEEEELGDERIVEVIGSALEDLADANDVPSPEERTVFHCKSAPSVGLRDYLRRIIRFSKSSRACFVTALIYLDTLVSTHKDFAIDAMNVHRYPSHCSFLI
eukprot:TRINITY_DN1774_c0_g1_i2.p1 TRINITY_DN1774_c0_g1~~TRINITY_DN1774_c0_g1_i2.p1  ORF type:complete len:170 (+),score=18.86 TRINITY_DN1774_c0_g1_i2:155-664(+)